jgi:hypothetical protein
MGQPIEVVANPSSTPGLVRFETNRSLAGMGHERYASPEDIVNVRTVDELARRLFATDEVRGVHIAGSVVTVELAETPAAGSPADREVVERLKEVVRDLYIYYPDATEAEEAAAEAGEDVPATEPATTS